jgi:hypothetical protein
VPAHGPLDPTLVARVADEIVASAEEPGSVFFLGGVTRSQAESLAELVVKRWQSSARRKVKNRSDERVHDLARGLITTVENPLHEEPNYKDAYRELARRLAPILEAE